MSRSVRHHYIPKYITKDFSNNDGKIYLYDNKLERWIPTYPSHIFVRKRYHAISDDPKDETEQDLESALSKFETLTASCVRSVREGRVLPEIDHHNLCSVVALQLLRTPLFREFAETATRRALFEVAKVIDKTGQLPLLPSTLQNKYGSMGLADMIETGAIKLHLMPNFQGIYLKLFEEIAQVFYRMRMCLLRACGSLRFLISDHPVQLCHQSRGRRSNDLSLMSDGIEVTMSLSSDVAVMFVHDVGDLLDLPVRNSIVEKINRRSAAFGKRHSVCHEQNSRIQKLIRRYSRVHLSYDVESTGGLNIEEVGSTLFTTWQLKQDGASSRLIDELRPVYPFLTREPAAYATLLARGSQRD